MVSFMLIIFTLQLIQSIRILWFCHRFDLTNQRIMSFSGGHGAAINLAHGSWIVWDILNHFQELRMIWIALDV
jgi:hypothetical protein